MTNIQKGLGVLLAAMLFLMLPAAANAQTCGSVLTTNTTLTSSLVCTSGNGLEVAASGITLDCAGHSITGPGSGIGVLLDNVSNVEVVNCTVDSFAVGFRIDGGNDNRLLQNVAVNNQSTSGGFNIINASVANWLEGNTSAFNVGRGFSVNGSDSNTLQFNEAFDNGFRGIDIINSNGSYILGNGVFTNLSAGIVIQDWMGGTSTGNMLERNSVQGSGSEGLAMFASGNTVVNNTFDLNGTWGIRDTSGGANAYGGNTCTGNGSGPSSPGGLC